MDLSLVVTVHNAPASVTNCLAGIQPALAGFTAELILVNDCSDEPTSALLREFAATAIQGKLNIRLLENERNLGYLRSANLGLGLARGKIIVLLNSDTVLPDCFAARILDCFASDARIGLAAPVASAGGNIRVPLPPGTSHADLNQLNQLFAAQPARYPELILPNGFCLCIRSNLLNEVGILGETYSPGFWEETDYGMRVRQAGYRTVLIDNLYLYHEMHASFATQDYSALTARNASIFARQWEPEYARLKKQFPPRKLRAQARAKLYSPLQRLLMFVRRNLAFLVQDVQKRTVLRQTN